MAAYSRPGAAENSHLFFGISQTQSLLFAMLVGGAIRIVLAVAALFHNSPELAYIQADNFMGAGAYLLREGHIPDPVFVPGYIYLCAFLQRCFHSHALAVLLSLQVALGICCIPIAFRLAKRLAGSRVAVIAAIFVAFDPLLIVQPALVLTEAVYIPLLLVTVLLFVTAMFRRGFDLRTAFLFLAAGIGAGVCTLTRSVGLVIPIAMCLTLLMSKHTLRLKVMASAAVVATFLLVISPVAFQNEVRYGHFAISSSGKFNFAALIVGPAKKLVTPDASDDLLGMWSAELGPNYKELPPFVEADKAASAAADWGKAHPGSLLRSIAKGQLTMLFAPDRSSWAAVLAFVHPSSGAFKIFASALALWRVLISIGAIAGAFVLVRRSHAEASWLFFVLLVLAHFAAAGAAGSGRFVATVAPYLDLLAAAFLLPREAAEASRQK